MFLEILPVGPFYCNCIILADEATKKGVVIDPGDEAPRILEVIRHHDLSITHLLHTHGHLDHIGATKKLHEETGAKIMIHEKDLWLYENLKMQGDLFGLATEPVAKVDEFLKEGTKLALGPEKILTLHTPGHTPGSCSFCMEIEGEKESLVFSGDTLFQGSIGRTDLWGGDYETILESIKKRLLPLREDTKVFPGHGNVTTIWDEKKKNPFLQV